MEAGHFDVLIVGAGLSGIGAAYHLQSSCPGKSYAILEGRAASGGTWDLFRYPGVRSDSDMYTLGYPFRPWKNPKAIADGPAILSYIRETAEEFGIDKKIRYSHRVERVRWSSRDARWTVDVRDPTTGETSQLTCGFLFVCAGYYDYAAGYTPEFAGRERFRGQIVHPQAWPADLDYAGKRVVVIGSGATAVTLVPEMARTAGHVTMLQRSPTYVFSAPEQDPVANWLRARLPAQRAHAITRWKNILLGMAMFNFSRRFPGRARRFFVGQVKRALGEGYDVATHFTPRYNPWDQRLCLVPDGDLFKAIKEGRAAVVTDHIDTFTETGIRLKSGAELPADVIVTATGLKLQFLGGLGVEIDGEKIDPATRVTYKSAMFSDVPNLAVAVGYTNASWTLKCDLTEEYVCRLLNYMDANGYAVCCPRRGDAAGDEQPLLDLSSGYIQRGSALFPRQGTTDPWKVYQNYLADVRLLRRTPVADPALEFRRAGASAGRGAAHEGASSSAT